MVLLVLVPSFPSAAAAQSLDDPVETAVGPYTVVTTVTHNGAGVAVETAIRGAEGGEPVTNAVVRLIATLQPAGDQVSADAAINNQGRYLGQLTLTGEGSWTVGIEVDGPLGPGSIEVERFEMPMQSGNQLASQLLFLGTIGVLGMGAWYVWWSSARARRRQGGSGQNVGSGISDNEGSSANGE